MNEIINCPLMERKVERTNECYFISMVADNLMIEKELPDDFVKVDNWREICSNCPNHLD